MKSYRITTIPQPFPAALGFNLTKIRLKFISMWFDFHHMILKCRRSSLPWLLQWIQNSNEYQLGSAESNLRKLMTCGVRWPYSHLIIRITSFHTQLRDTSLHWWVDFGAALLTAFIQAWLASNPSFMPHMANYIRSSLVITEHLTPWVSFVAPYS